MVVEIVELRVRTEVSDAEFIRAAEQASAFLRTRPGFIRRRLAKGEDGVWLDCVEWASMPEAVAAAKAFNATEATIAFNSAIAPGSARMRHLTVATKAD